MKPEFINLTLTELKPGDALKLTDLNDVTQMYTVVIDKVEGEVGVDRTLTVTILESNVKEIPPGNVVEVKLRAGFPVMGTVYRGGLTGLEGDSSEASIIGYNIAQLLRRGVNGSYSIGIDKLITFLKETHIIPGDLSETQSKAVIKLAVAAHKKALKINGRHVSYIDYESLNEVGMQKTITANYKTRKVDIDMVRDAFDKFFEGTVLLVRSGMLGDVDIV